MSAKLDHPATAPITGLADFPAFDNARLLSPVVLIGLARIAEFGMLIMLGYVIAVLYVDRVDIADTSQYLIAIAATALLANTLFQAFKLYSVPALTSLRQNAARVLLAWMIAIFALVAAVFFLKIGPDFSRVWLALWFVAGIAALGVSRTILAFVTRAGIRNGRLTRRAVVYGGGPGCEALLAALEADQANDVRIAGVFDDRGDDRVGRLIAGYPKLGNLEELVEFGRTHAIDMLIVALPLAAESRLNQIIRRLWVLPIDIRLAATASQLRFRPRAYSFIGSVPMLDVYDKPIADWGTVAKWLFDKSVAALALALLSPLMALVALAIKLDSKGPVLFRQKRYGFNNELIEVLKFRSMYVSQSDAGAARLVTRGDPRVTAVGRIIRKTSLDELPQLINVLKGELSLVGPRPHALQAKAADQLYHDVVDGYFARHKVRPGITGWAQINGWRGETDTPEKIQQRVACDIHYIENWSVLFDLYILARTPFALLKTDNAY